MHGHWRSGEVLLDPEARNTRENALGVARAAREVGADEVVVVTSRWHAPRAKLLVRAAVPGRISVTTSSPPDAPALRLPPRDLLLFAVLPVQLVDVRARGERRTAPRTGRS